MAEKLQKNVLLSKEDIELLDKYANLSDLKTGDVIALLLHEAQKCDELMMRVGRKFIKEHKKHVKEGDETPTLAAKAGEDAF